METIESLVVQGGAFNGSASSRSAVRWGAVIAGAVIAAAVSVMLLTAGTGLGFMSVSPWHHDGVSGSTLLMSSVVWLLATQVIAYGVAGYVTGRLRTSWTDVTQDEGYFRDTAHGFLVWALSAVISVVLLSSTVVSAVSGTVKAGAGVLGAGAGAGAVVWSAEASNRAGAGQPMDYFTDVLLRPAQVSASTGPQESRQEVSRIVLRAVSTGALSDSDRDYLTEVVAQRAGVDSAQAQQRIEQLQGQLKQAEQQARQTADAALKVLAAFSIWAFVSMLLGAFVASLAAMIGGRARRD